MRILIVDDAPILRASFARIVTALGHSIAAEAATADEARSLARDVQPDAIVVDGRLTGAGIVALISELRAAVPEASVFVTAALDETALVRAAVAGGAAGALRRPFLFTEIHERLRSFKTSSSRDPA